jgi:hypothetical protein
MNIIYILFAMTLWGFVHSITASLTLKEKAIQIFGSGLRAPVPSALRKTLYASPPRRLS